MFLQARKGHVYFTELAERAEYGKWVGHAGPTLRCARTGGATIQGIFNSCVLCVIVALIVTRDVQHNCAAAMPVMITYLCMRSKESGIGCDCGDWAQPDLFMERRLYMAVQYKGGIQYMANTNFCVSIPQFGA